MSKKCLFAITNALLVGIVGLLIGLFCANIFSTNVGIAAFVCFLVSLCIPSAIFFLAAKAGNAGIVMTSLLMVAELAINITFMAKPALDAKVFAITQACVIGAFLIAMLVFIAVSGKKEQE